MINSGPTLNGQAQGSNRNKTNPAQINNKQNKHELHFKVWNIHGLKGKVHPRNMLFSDVRSDKIGKNAVDRFSISPLVLKIFAIKVEKVVIWRQPS